ncbi:mdt-27, partial [Pristionchus pacificus]
RSMDYGGMPIRPPQGSGNGTSGMQQARGPGMAPMGTPGGPVPLQQQQQSMLQLSAPPTGRPRPQPHASMTPGVRVLNVQRFPGGPVNQRRILVPVTQQGQPTQQQMQMQQYNLHLQQQNLQLQMMQPREGETPPPPPAASPPVYTKQQQQQQLMPPVHLQLPPSASAAAAGMVRRPAPITGTPQPQGGRQMRPGGMTPQQHQQHQQMILQKHRMQQEQRQAAAAAAAAGRPPQQQAAAAGTPQQQHHPRSATTGQRTPGGASSAARAAAAANGQSQQQSPRYNRQQMQLIMRTTLSAVDKVRQLRSTVCSSYLGGPPTTSAHNDETCSLPSIVDAPPLLVLSEEQRTKRMERIQAAKGVLDSLHESLRYLPNSMVQMFGGRERNLADMMDTEDMWDPESGQSVGEEIERVLIGEDLRFSYFASAFECMSKMPMGRNLKGLGLKEGLNAHSSFLLCLTKMQNNKRLQQQRNLKIRLLNSGPRDTRFEMCITTPHQIHPTTTMMRVVITVCDGCLARATFLGPNELVDSSTEERSGHLVYRQMSVNATEALLSTAKGRQMSLMSSINSIFTFLQQYPQCLQSTCCECGKCLRDFMPPTRFVNLSPLKYAHPECHQPDR